MRTDSPGQAGATSEGATIQRPAELSESAQVAEREIVEFAFDDHGMGKFDFWLGDRKCRVPLASLWPMASALGGAIEQFVEPINCVYAVAPLLKALNADGWVVEPPKCNICNPETKSTSEHI